MPQARVPVVSLDGQPLMPTTAAHARIMLRDQVATPRRNKLGLFYIQMRIPVGTRPQPMALALDPGARSDGIAVASHHQVEASGPVNLPDNVHKRVESRRNLRHARRFRQTPRRPQRFNNRRHGGRYWLSPTHAARGHARLEAVNELSASTRFLGLSWRTCATARVTGRGAASSPPPLWASARPSLSSRRSHP